MKRKHAGGRRAMSVLRKTFGLFAVLVLVSLAAVGWFLHDLGRTVHTKIPPANSRIYVTVDIGFPEKKVVRTEITDPEDAAFLRALFGQSYAAQFDTPICPFGANRISFELDSGRIDFYPAMDDCDLVRYGRSGKKLFQIGEAQHGQLTLLLQKYGATTQAS